MVLWTRRILCLFLANAMLNKSWMSAKIIPATNLTISYWSCRMHNAHARKHIDSSFENVKLPIFCKLVYLQDISGWQISKKNTSIILDKDIDQLTLTLKFYTFLKMTPIRMRSKMTKGEEEEGEEPMAEFIGPSYLSSLTVLQENDRYLQSTFWVMITSSNSRLTCLLARVLFLVCTLVRRLVSVRTTLVWALVSVPTKWLQDISKCPNLGFGTPVTSKWTQSRHPSFRQAVIFCSRQAMLISPNLTCSWVKQAPGNRFPQPWVQDMARKVCLRSILWVAKKQYNSEQQPWNSKTTWMACSA